MNASVIVTYRCPMRCQMCNSWAHPTQPADEFPPELLLRLPRLNTVNVTGGEPFARSDLAGIIEILSTRAARVIVSTSGWHEEEALELARQFPDLAFRVSLDGLSATHDEIRGRVGSFDRAVRTLLRLRTAGVADVGIGVTLSDRNARELLDLHEFARRLRVEFAVASCHNSFFFHTRGNRIARQAEAAAALEELANRMLDESSPKSWFRALFNLGLIDQIEGRPQLLPCGAARHSFTVDPAGEVLPCSGMDPRSWYASMGNLRDHADFASLWSGAEACAARARASGCQRNCWMIGSIAPVMERHLARTGAWVLHQKLRHLGGGRVTVADAHCLRSSEAALAGADAGRER